MNQEAFLEFTIHYIDSNWHLCNFLLDIIPFFISHSGVNIAQTITNILEEFKKRNKELVEELKSLEEEITNQEISEKEIKEALKNFGEPSPRTMTEVKNYFKFVSYPRIVFTNQKIKKEFIFFLEGKSRMRKKLE